MANEGHLVLDFGDFTVDYDPGSNLTGKAQQDMIALLERVNKNQIRTITQSDDTTPFSTAPSTPKTSPMEAVL